MNLARSPSRPWTEADPALDDLSDLLAAQALKAVLVIDLVESVRLMASDESGVVARWQGFVRFARELVPANAGRLVKSLGDGLLAEFDHGRDAVRTAHRLQRHFDAFNQSAPPGQQMRLRAGINTTHRYADEHDVYGHGVNLAARIAGLARPGTTVVTASVHDTLADGLDGRLEDMGESYLKHWPHPVRTWCVHPIQPVQAGPAALPTTPPGWPEPVGEAPADFRASIAVIPFEARNPSPETFVIGELIADGVIAQLAGSPHLRVLSRLSTTAFRGRGASPADIDAQLNAAFVLSGSYFTLDGRVLITAELTDARRNEVVWAERLAGETGDLMQVHSELLDTLSAACAHALLDTEVRRSSVRPLPQLDSNALMLGGIVLMHRSSPRDMQRSRELLEAVADRHARVAAPRAWLAKWHILQVVQGSTDNPAQAFRHAVGIADRALDLEPQSSLAMAMKGHAICHLGPDAGDALQLLEAATRSNPSDAMAWLYSGLWSAMWGPPEDAVRKAENALRLSPLDPQRYYFELMLAVSHLANDEPEKALALSRSSLARNRLHRPTVRTLLTAAFEAGEMDEARDMFHTLMRLQPDLNMASYLASGGQSPLRLRGARALAAFGLRSS
jgi:adenylate cyclase